MKEKLGNYRDTIEMEAGDDSSASVLGRSRAGRRRLEAMPYELCEEDGKLSARRRVHAKGTAQAALYALKIARELSCPRCKSGCA